FVSFGEWETIEQVRGWKTSPEFKERMARVLQHVDEFRPAELALVASAEHGAAEPAGGHYRKDAIATFDGPPRTGFRYMRAGGHRPTGLKADRLVGVADGVVTVAAEVYTPDGSTFETTILHRLAPPRGVETTMRGGPFDGARFVHSYTPLGDRTR